MCGFAGFIDLHGPAARPRQRQALLRAMGQRLANRGPDDEKCYDDGLLAFVFRRLAIVDLETGDQPIWNEDRSLFVAVNGEIYNHQDVRGRLESRHRFRTKSDAEVVLHLYEECGAAALEELQGMFAIAIWQPGERRLFLARDRVGIKPLYYAITARALLFGSELKALLAHPDCPREVSWADIDVHAGAGGTGIPSYVQGVEHLPGGHHAIFEHGRLRTARYWSIDRFFETGDRRMTTADAIEQYAALFRDSVRRHLMSDVPVGAFLSGGLDSSMVVAAAADSTHELRCFHVLEDAVFRSGDSGAARLLADGLGLPLYQVHFPHDTLAADLDFGLDTFEYFVWLLDSPQFNLEWFFKHELHRFAKTCVADLKVILLGQGADEFAGGYSNQYANSAGSWRAYLENLASDQRREGLQQSGLDSRLSALVRDLPGASGQAAAVSVFHREMRQRVEVLQRHNLWHEDRTAAGQGIESRVPFLDHRLLELLASVPERLHEKLFWDKRLLRDVARRLLPRELVERRKVGFFSARNITSIDTIGRELIGRVFPSFREKYLATPDAIFAVDPVVRLYLRVRAGGRAGAEAQSRLVACMAAAVFERLVRSGGSCPARVGPPSPLGAIAPAAFRAWGAPNDDPIPAWSSDMRVVLEPGVRVLAAPNGQDRTRRLVVLRDEAVDREIALTRETSWITDLFAHLAGSEKGVTVGRLRRMFQVPPAALDDALTVLYAEDWLSLPPSGTTGGPASKRGRAVRDKATKSRVPRRSSRERKAGKRGIKP